MSINTPDINDIYSISHLNRAVKNVLEDVFPSIWVKGEISNLAKPASGHLYFSLKDSQAQVRCAMFKNRQSGLRFQLKSGMEVLARANISLYEGRGEYQLIIDSLQPAGDGTLQLAFEQLKQKLAKEGLFDEDKKQSIPLYPKSIGIITSPTGAAIRDILSVLKRRYPYGNVIIYPVPVQGDGATFKISNAIQQADHRKDCDVLILSRGGGSIEDLWSFNEESVSRAISSCSIPIVSGIGHEIDFTIADFVADYRAPTPSVAAETVSPDSEKLLQHLDRQFNQFKRYQEGQLMQLQRHVDSLARQLTHPQQRLASYKQQTKQSILKMNLIIQKKLNVKHIQLDNLNQKIKERNPLYQIKQKQLSISNMQGNLIKTMQYNLKRMSQRVEIMFSKNEAFSPKATLNRGYAIVSKKDSGEILRQAKQLSVGEKLTIRLATANIDATTDDIYEH